MGSRTLPPAGARRNKSREQFVRGVHPLQSRKKPSLVNANGARLEWPTARAAQSREAPGSEAATGAGRRGVVWNRRFRVWSARRNYWRGGWCLNR